MTFVAIIAAILCAYLTYDDLRSTKAAIDAGAVEGDRLYRAVGKAAPWVRIGVSVAMVVGMFWAISNADGWPVIQWAAIATIAVWSVYVFKVARRNDANARKLRAGAATGQVQPGTGQAATGASGAEADQPRRGGSRRNHG